MTTSPTSRVPRCVRLGPDGRSHWCAELCEVEHGQPCRPPEGSAWRPWRPVVGMPDVGDVANYRRLRAALPEGELTERQQTCLRWLAGWDTDTASAVASLFRFARGERD